MPERAVAFQGDVSIALLPSSAGALEHDEACRVIVAERRRART
jgi:hypothetical protein